MRISSFLTSTNDNWRQSGVLILAAFFGVTFLLGSCGESDQSSPTNSPVTTETSEASTIDSSVTYIEQEAEERTFNDWTLEEVEFEEPVSIGNISWLRIFGDRIFVYDRANANVKRYALNGELEAVYGKGEGQGPGEIASGIGSFWVRGKEEVWLLEQSVQELSRFRYDGTFVDSFHPEGRPHRVAAVGQDRLVVQTLVRPELFSLLNEEGEVLRRFGKVIEESQQSYMLALEAYMYPVPDGGFIWAPIYASYLYFYGDDARLDRRIELIDGYPFPIDEMQPNPRGVTYRNIQRPKRTLSVSVTDKEIFVNILSGNTEDGDPHGTIVDRYDRSTGQYLDSIRLPPGGRYHVHNGVIYGQAPTDTTLQAFRIRR